MLPCGKSLSNISHAIRRPSSIQRSAPYKRSEPGHRPSRESNNENSSNEIIRPPNSLTTEEFLSRKKEFATYKFFLDSLEPNIKKRIERAIKLLGAEQELFFSKNCTHVITTKPIPHYDNLLQVDTTHTNQSKKVNPGAKDNIVDNAIQWNKVLWSVDVMVKTVDFFLQSNSGTRKDTQEKRALGKALQEEKLYGLSTGVNNDAQSKRPQFIPISGYYLMVEDADQVHRPPILRQFSKKVGDITKSLIPWPTLKNAGKTKSPFAKKTPPPQEKPAPVNQENTSAPAPVVQETTPVPSQALQVNTSAPPQALQELPLSVLHRPLRDNILAPLPPQQCQDKAFPKHRPLTHLHCDDTHARCSGNCECDCAPGQHVCIYCCGAENVHPDFHPRGSLPNYKYTCVKPAKDTMNNQATLPPQRSTLRVMKAMSIRRKPNANHDPSPPNDENATGDSLPTKENATRGPLPTNNAVRNPSPTNNQPADSQQFSLRASGIQPYTNTIQSASVIQDLKRLPPGDHISRLDKRMIDNIAQANKELNERLDRDPPQKRKRESRHCENCNVLFESLEEHIQSETHQTFIRDTNNFSALDSVLVLTRRPYTGPLPEHMRAFVDASIDGKDVVFVTGTKRSHPSPPESLPSTKRQKISPSIAQPESSGWNSQYYDVFQ